MRGHPRTMLAWACALAVAAGCGRGPSELQFETAQVDRGRLVSRVTATGTLSALVTVQVGSQVSGRIAQLMVDFNSQVTRGQVIARIDPQLFEAALEQARANAAAAQGELTRARVQAADAERQAERTRSLAEEKLVAQAELDTALATANAARAGVDVAEGRLAQARAALHQAQVNLQLTSILSPINGVVISRSVDVGQTVAASLQAPTLFVIAEDLAKMQVDTSVAEADVGKLEAGMGASFVVDAFPGERFQGTVRQIRNAPQTVQNVVTYDAVIDVANPELKLRPGMTANVTFVTAEKDDVVRIPNAALRFRAPPEMLARLRGESSNGGNRGERDGGWARRSGLADAPDRRMVWVMRDATPTRASIRVGLTDGSFTEVVEGELHEGDRVITDVTGGIQPAQPPRGGGRGMGRVF